MILAYSITQDLMDCMIDNYKRPQHGLFILEMLYMRLSGCQAWGCLEQCPTWDPRWLPHAIARTHSGAEWDPASSSEGGDVLSSKGHTVPHPPESGALSKSKADSAWDLKNTP